MRVTIFGASGLLGKALMHEWSGDAVTGLSSRDTDIRDARRLQQVVQETRPEWIVLAAAYTDVDGCESNPDLAFAVNRDGAVNVAIAVRMAGARLVFLSSDYVFDGKKTTPYETGDARNPQTVYGRTKAEAEIKLLELMPECCIVRTSWLFGTGGKCFPDTILKLAASRPAIDVVNDQEHRRNRKNGRPRRLKKCGTGNRGHPVKPVAQESLSLGILKLGLHHSDASYSGSFGT